MNITEIQDLIKFVAKSGVSEVELELKDFKITIKTPPRKKRGNGQQDEPEVIQTQVPIAVIPQNQVVIAAPVNEPPPPEKKKEEEKEEDDDLNTIKSPMIGTFYRSPDPEKPPFVNVGDEIKEGQVICIIEAMKLFNEIEAEVSGKIVKILVDDKTPVEYDQPMFLIEPH